MRYGSVKHIALYYKAIPGMLRLLRQERTELEGNYYGLRGLACDGMPRGSSPGKPTEESGLRALENGVSERLAEIAEAERVLSGDEACIRACLDALNGKYKEVIVMRYVRGYSWAKISARMGTADSTARDWHTRAMERLGEVLEELPEADALAVGKFGDEAVCREHFGDFVHGLPPCSVLFCRIITRGRVKVYGAILAEARALSAARAVL